MTICEPTEILGLLPDVPEQGKHYSPEAAWRYVRGIVAMPEPDFLEFVEDIRSEAEDPRVGGATIRMLDTVSAKLDGESVPEDFIKRSDVLTYAILDAPSPVTLPQA